MKAMKLEYEREIKQRDEAIQRLKTSDVVSELRRGFESQARQLVEKNAEIELDAAKRVADILNQKEKEKIKHEGELTALKKQHEGETRKWKMLHEAMQATHEENTNAHRKELQ